MENLTKTPTKALQSPEKDLVEKLITIQKAILFKKIEEKESTGTIIRNIKFSLEDADENLDSMLSDDEAFHLDSLSFDVPQNSNILNIDIAQKKKRRK